MGTRSRISSGKNGMCKKDKQLLKEGFTYNYSKPTSWAVSVINDNIIDINWFPLHFKFIHFKCFVLMY